MGSDSQDGSLFGVYGQRYDAAGNKIGGEFRINTYTTMDQCIPRVKGLFSGGFVVTWTSYGQDGSDLDIYGQRFDAAGNKAGSEFRVNTYITSTQVLNSIAALGGRGFIVTWQSTGQDGSGFGIYGQRFDAGGNEAGTEFRINTYTTNYQTDSSVTALNNGGFVVTWESKDQDGSGYGIYGQRFDASGNRAGNEFRVNTYAANEQSDSSVTALSSGGFVVTWTSEGQDGSDSGVFGQRYDASGNKTGNEFRINSYTAGFQGGSSVTGLSAGRFIVTWSSMDQDGNSQGVYGQLYDANGMRTGTEFRINTYTTGYQGSPSVTGLNDGGFVVTWDSRDDNIQDGSFSGVYGQRFHADGTPYSAPINQVGDSGNNTLYGGAGNDTLNGMAGNDTLCDLAGNDILIGGAGDDILNGGLGNDYAYYNTATSEVKINLNLTTSQATGGAGADTLLGIENLLGSNFNDTLTGNSGNNVLVGGNGTDALMGGAGNDILNGGAGNDFLAGATGVDTMIGGAGADTFLFNSPLIAANKDCISDFSAVDDTIKLDKTIFTKLSVGLLNAAYFKASATGLGDANDYILYNTTSGALLYDADGSGTGVAIQFATLEKKPVISAADFTVIA